MSSINTKHWFTPPQVAELFGVGHEKVLVWIRNGDLEAVDFSERPDGRPRWKCSAAHLEAFLERRAASRPQQPQKRRRRKGQDDDVICFYK